MDFWEELRMNKLKGTEDFLRINQRVNIFDIVSCKEEQASQIIAWLLNPREAHNFGSSFFKAMLDELNGKDVKIFKGKECLENDDKKNLISNCLKKYQEVIIQTEYCFKEKCKNEDGRIDIFLCMEDPKILFIIENKYGAKEHNNQTQIYYDHFSDKKYEDYSICYIYLDINGYYEDGERGLADNEHWNIINYEWIVDFLKENLTGSYVDKILQDIYIEFTENYKNEPYFNKFYSQAVKLYNDYKGDVGKYEDPYPYEPNSLKNLQPVLYDTFYYALSEYSNWDKLKFDEKIYCIDSSRTNDISITLNDVDIKHDELNKTLTEKRKWWPFWVNLALHKPKDEENKKKKQYMEIKLICTNEYIDEDNCKDIPGELKEVFTDKKIKNKIDQKIIPFKSGDSIKTFFLKKDIIKDFDFENEDNINSLIGKIEKYKPSLEKMCNIFFPEENR